jgi:hypothetical protein
MGEGERIPRQAGYLAYAVGVLALLAVSPAAARAYTLKTTAAGYNVRWWKQPIRMKVSSDLERSMEPGRARQAALIAAEAWRGLPGVPDLLIDEGSAPGFDAERRTNGIYLARQWSYDPRRLAVTVSSYTPDGRLMGADILINGKEKFDLLSEDDSGRRDSVFDLASVLTHEMGHVLGLDENPDDPEATMFPYTRANETHQRTLSEDDEEGVIELYSAALPEAALSCSLASTAGGRVNSSAIPVFILVVLALVVRRRGRPSRPAMPAAFLTRCTVTLPFSASSERWARS